MFYNKVLIKIIFAMAIVVFLSFNLFGLAYSVNSMKMNNDGTMNDCFLMTQTSLCTMNFAEHMNIWKLMFNSLLPIMGLMNIILLVLAIVFVALTVKKILTQASASLMLRWRRYIRQTFSNIFNPLLEAFSGGILHSQIYA